MIDTSVLLFLCLFLILALQITASAGDSNREFQNCVDDCLRHCDVTSFPALHRFMLWDCDGECKYTCMHMVSTMLKNQYDVVWKFYGHWPYTRILGLQEPAAAVFSLGNMLPHIHNLFCNRRIFQRPGARFGRYISLYSVIALLAWSASAAFHARKIDPFIGFDYGLAFVFISYGVWLAFYRMWWEFRGDRDNLMHTFWAICYFCWVALQVTSTVRGHVHFDDHMQLSIGLSVLHAMVWLLFIIFSGSRSKYFCLFCQAWFGAASLLELYDFPPFWGIFDAHALWHAATIPLGFWWYQFWSQDSDYCIERLTKEGETGNTLVDNDNNCVNYSNNNSSSEHGCGNNISYVIKKGDKLD